MNRDELFKKLTIRLLPYFKRSFMVKTFHTPDQKIKKYILLPIIEKTINAWKATLIRARHTTPSNKNYLDVWELDDDMLPCRFNKRLFTDKLDMKQVDCERVLESLSKLRGSLKKDEVMLPKEMKQLLELDGVYILNSTD